MSNKIALATIKNPTDEQILLYKAVNRELKKLANDTLSEEARSIIVSRFVDNFDFDNAALQHKSAGGWAQMIMSELTRETKI